MTATAATRCRLLKMQLNLANLQQRQSPLLWKKPEHQSLRLLTPLQLQWLLLAKQTQRLKLRPKLRPRKRSQEERSVQRISRKRLHQLRLLRLPRKRRSQKQKQSQRLLLPKLANCQTLRLTQKSKRSCRMAAILSLPEKASAPTVQRLERSTVSRLASN